MTREAAQALGIERDPIDVLHDTSLRSPPALATRSPEQGADLQQGSEVRYRRERNPVVSARQRPASQGIVSGDPHDDSASSLTCSHVLDRAGAVSDAGVLAVS
jgi:hypothetical protein